MKTLSNRLRNFKLDVNRLPSDIKVESVVNDTPRKVTEFHYCRTQPQPRTSPHVAALSNKMLQELDLNPQALLEDEETPLFLSGAKLLPNSEVTPNSFSPSVTTIVDTSSGTGLGSWGMAVPKP